MRVISVKWGATYRYGERAGDPPPSPLQGERVRRMESPHTTNHFRGADEAPSK